MKKAATKTADQDIPELKRDQLGKGVRGKHLKHFMQGSNGVILQPEIQKTFPTSEAVNKALPSRLAFAQETLGLGSLKPDAAQTLRRVAPALARSRLTPSKYRSPQFEVATSVG